MCRKPKVDHEQRHRHFGTLSRVHGRIDGGPRGKCRWPGTPWPTRKGSRCRQEAPRLQRVRIFSGSRNRIQKLGSNAKHRSLGRASHNPPGKLNGQYRHGERTKAAIAAADIQRIAKIAPHWPDVNTHEVLGWCMLACAHPADRVDSPFVGGARRSTNGWALLLCEATAKAD